MSIHQIHEILFEKTVTSGVSGKYLSTTKYYFLKVQKLLYLILYFMLKD